MLGKPFRNRSDRGLGLGFIAAAAIGVCLVRAPAGWGGSVEEARKLLAAKQYDQVDKALRDELTKQRPSVQALRVSLDAALAAGRVVTAHRRATALVKATGSRDMALVHLAARVAAWAGDRRLALSRFRSYAQKHDARSEKLRSALVYLIRHGKFPEEFKKYVKLYGAGPGAWELGTRLLGRLLRDGEGAAALDLAAFLLAHFRDVKQVDYVYGRLRNASEGLLLGKDARRARVRPLKVMVQAKGSTYEHVEWMFHAASGAAKPQEVLDCLFAIQAAAREPLPPGVFHRFSALSKLAADGAELQAGRKFLTLERLYRDSPDPRDYARYVRLLCDQAAVFTIKGKALISPREAVRKYQTLLRKFPGGRGIGKEIEGLVDAYVGGKSPDGRAILARHVAVLSPARVSRLVDDLKGKGFAQIHNRAIQGRNLRDALTVKVALLRWFNTTKNKAALLETARTHMMARPGSLDRTAMRDQVFKSQLLTPAEKLALLREVVTKGGMSQPMRELLRDLSRAWAKDPALRQFRGLARHSAAGTDLAMRTHVDLYKMTGYHRRQPRRPAADFLKAYRKPIPAGWDACKSVEHLLVLGIWERDKALCGNRPENDGPRCLQWGARAPMGEILTDSLKKLAEIRAGTSLYQLAPRVIPLLAGNDPRAAELWGYLAGATNSPKTRRSPFSAHYGRMGWDNAVRYVYGQRTAWENSRQHFVAELAKVAAMGGFRMTDAALLGDVIKQVHEWSGPTVKVPPRLTSALWRNYLALRGKPPAYDVQLEAMLCSQLRRSGHQKEADAHLSGYLKGLRKRTAAEQTAALAELCARGGLPSDKPGKLTPLHKVHTLLKLLTPLAARLPQDAWIALGVGQDLYREAAQLLASKDWAKDKEAAAAADTLGRTLVRALLAGAPFHGDPPQMFDLVIRYCEEAAGRQDWQRLSDLTIFLADVLPLERRWRWNWTYEYRVSGLLKKLDAAKAHEIVYAFCRQVEHHGWVDAKFEKQFVVLKARASREIPDLISVPRTDPTYDLHLAAQALALGDETRAWELTLPKLSLLGKNWESLDQQYLAWCIEQVRKQKRLPEALKLAFTILLREATLEPDTAAGISLTKGDIYRDMQNYQAARIEYEALKSNKRYQETPAGQRATYHLVELLILTKDYESAERILERLADSGSLEKQAEAYYLYAKMAFDQERYKEASEYIQKVRDRAGNHVEAALLEGELNLVLPGGLQNTEVQVGSPELATVAVPGRELTLKLKDANLSIARGSSSVPVTVRTTKGGDVEHVNLMPSVTGKNLFTGTIATALGTAKPGNLKLELGGDDRVSYIIDPEFQRANDLDYPPKYLEVKSDGRLVASSGEILSEEEEQRRALEARQAAAEEEAKPAWFIRSSRVVRPGNEIHVQVTDFDRDVGDRPDAVPVTLRTTSGDVLEAVELKETGPHTGVFQSTVPTGVPLPRALASDTLEGKDPSSMINVNKPGPWSSLADGKKPKWVEVDTMSSHLVKSASIELAHPDRVQRVRLMGTLAGDEEELASYPLGAEEMGLRGAYYADRQFKDKRFERTDPQINFDFGQGTPHPKMPRENFSIRWTGKIVPLHSEEYTFYTDADDGVKLWIDGKLVVDDWTPKASRAEGKVALQAGRKYDIRLDYFESNKSARVRLAWASKSLPRQIVPQSQLMPGDAGLAARRDDLYVEVAPHPKGLTKLDEIRKHLRLAAQQTFYQQKTSFDRGDTRWPHNWYVARMTGTFYVKENRQLEVRFAQELPSNSRQFACLVIDGREALGGLLDQTTVQATRVVNLVKGPHKLEMAVSDYLPRSHVKIEYRTDEGTFAPLPAEWFSVEKTPDLTEHVLPKARISPAKGVLTAALVEPMRLRRLRWVLEEFTGSDVAVKELRVVDADGKGVVPVEQDFSAGTRNRVLEIAPGDDIAVTYTDAKRLRSGSPTLTARLTSAFYDGEIVLAYEVISDDGGGGKRSEFFPAKRCRIGDQLMIIVTEHDDDMTDERDRCEVTVRTSGGETLKLAALESALAQKEGQNHSGVFLAVLKLGKKTGKDTIKVAPGDWISASYLDRENTQPGIPYERSYSLTEGGPKIAELIAYRTNTVLVEDTSTEAARRLKRLGGVRKQPGAVIRREQIVARHPEYTGPAPTTAPAATRPAAEMPVVSVRAPMLFELKFPRLALNTASTAEVTVVAESELQAAEKAKRKPTVLNVPVHLKGIEEVARSKGYPIQLRSHIRRRAQEMLEDGVFAGIIRLQIGKPGDEIDDLVMPTSGALVARPRRADPDEDLRNRVPTLIVRGSDVVHLTFKDKETQLAARMKVRLLSDARLELLDRTFTAEKPAIHLGEKFHIRLTDPDQDRSDKRDSVQLRVAGSSGDDCAIALAETLAHSGVFTGEIKPEFFAGAAAKGAGKAAGKKTSQIDRGDEVLSVNFGDEVTFRYRDKLSVTSRRPVEVTAAGKIHFGADGRLACFTKRFKDPEMAVRTSFLTAEALFEIAKQHRKLKQNDKADEAIARGKRILEEAMRDYPRTRLVSQGEFLLANLAEELGNYDEATGRYSQVIRNWPESEYADHSQFKKALCYEKMGRFDKACEEYVKVLYIYPDSPLVANATLRLGRYYHQSKSYRVAARIFYRFQQRNPAHKLAAMTLFMAGQCYMQNKDFDDAIRMFTLAVDEYTDDKKVRPEAMYWLADCYFNRKDYVKSYQTFTKLHWDYPQSKWAKIARGRLTEDKLIDAGEKLE